MAPSAAARVRRPSIQNIRERSSDHVPPGPNTRTLNILLRGQFRPQCRFIHIAQQCGPLATYRGVPAASTICGCIEDGELDTIECESAEAALATMLIRGRDVAMIFADIRLPGVMDGIDLAREVRLRWPFLPVILTSGYPREGQLPLGIDFMSKPWQPLNLLVAAKQALSVSVRAASKAP